MLTRSLFLLSASIVALAACSSTEAADDVGHDEAPQTAPACAPGSAFHGPGWEDDVGVVGYARAPHDRAGFAFGSGLNADPAANPVTLLATGTGELAGNFQWLASADWSMCSGKVKIAPNAHVEFGGGGLTQEQRQACAKDMKRPECYVLAHYCESGTLEVPANAPPRCVLKAGVPLQATVHGGPACVNGRDVPRPSFDEDLEPIANDRAKHDESGYVLSRAVPTGADVRTTVLAFGSGKLDGNVQELATSAWKVCGPMLFVHPMADLEFLGGGLTAEQLQSCVEDLDGAHCETLAHYCKPGSLRLIAGGPPRCRLKDGVEVRATFTRPR